MYRSRITNDEKGLRRVIRKFHAFATTVNGAPTTKDDASTAMNDAREAFLLELASFELSWRKSVMICEAESRQVEEYESERRRIGT
jgi:THO complex subunit 7